MRLEISKTVIYNIATKDIAPRTIYHTGATPSRRERSNMIVNRVKELRTAAGMTQKALADQLGVTVPTVSKWELGQRTPELERVFRMTLIFGVPIEEIVQRTESA